MIPRIKEMLLRLALENPGTKGKYKLAAGVVYKKHLVATGINRYKTHPIMLSQGYREGQVFIHAEAEVIKNALRLITQEQLQKSSLYVVRVKKNQEGNYIEGLAKPCLGCQKLITTFGIETVEWTVDPHPTGEMSTHTGEMFVKRG